MNDTDARIWMYETMFKSRRFEAALKGAYMEGKQPLFNMAKGPIPGEMHLSDGQEPCAVGVCVHLRASDAVTATHRSHHVAIAKGVALDSLAAEIFGKRSGLSGGRGGHMHLFDASVNFCCSGIVAQGMAPAVGAARAAQLDGRDDIAVSFIGEGAANQGAFHEALNLAGIWRAPVVFVIEDNAWGISVPKHSATAIERNADRASAYGMPGAFVADNDPDRIRDVAGAAIARARSGKGPSLIEIQTVRLEGHFMGDAEGYRPQAERQGLVARDPLPEYRRRMLADGVLESRLADAERCALQQVDAAFEFARAAEYPCAAEAFDHVFS